MNGMYSGNQSRVFFGAKPDNDECLIDRVKLCLKTNGMLLGLFSSIARVRKLRWVLFGIQPESVRSMESRK